MANSSRSSSIWSGIRYYAADSPLVSRFRWDFHTLGASWTFLASAVPCYLLLVLLLKLLLSFRKRPVPLGYLPALHNAVLTIGSLVMFVGCLVATVVEIQENSSSSWIWSRKSRRGAGAFNWLLCFPLGTRTAGRVFFWSYVYYMSKFYEILDTVILVLRKKPLTFLHVFHHSMVIVMCFLWLEFTQSLQIIGLLINTSVHVVMYTYYFLCSIGLHPAWKKLVTNCQIYQFISSFVFSIGTLLLHFLAGGCAGMGAWFFNASFNFALLLLFANFHTRQYSSSSSGSNKRRSSKPKAQ